MAKKKTTSKRVTAKKPATKIVNQEETCCNNKHHRLEEHGYLGRLLLALGIIFTLNALGVFDGVSVWYQIMMVAGFTFLRF